jgi:hypothetical protein
MTKPANEIWALPADRLARMACRVTAPLATSLTTVRLATGRCVSPDRDAAKAWLRGAAREAGVSPADGRLTRALHWVDLVSLVAL